MLIRHGEAGRQGLLWPFQDFILVSKGLDHHSLCEGS